MKSILTGIVVMYMIVRPSAATTASLYSGARQLCDALNEREPRLELEYNGTYKGCFKDAPHRAINGHHIELPYMTAEVCYVYCLSRSTQYLVYGTQHNTHCFCAVMDDSYKRYGQASETECNMHCSGNRYQTCGGPYRNSVYFMKEKHYR